MRDKMKKTLEFTLDLSNKQYLNNDIEGMIEDFDRLRDSTIPDIIEDLQFRLAEYYNLKSEIAKCIGF
jgi:hypothetical protein